MIGIAIGIGFVVATALTFLIHPALGFIGLGLQLLMMVGATKRQAKAEAWFEEDLQPGEWIGRVAFQHRIYALGRRRQALAVTDRRLIWMKRQIFGGCTLRDVAWDELDDLAIRENNLSGLCGSNLWIKPVGTAASWSIKCMPNELLKLIYQYVNQRRQIPYSGAQNIVNGQHNYVTATVGEGQSQTIDDPGHSKFLVSAIVVFVLIGFVFVLAKLGLFSGPHGASNGTAINAAEIPVEIQQEVANTMQPASEVNSPAWIAAHQAQAESICDGYYVFLKEEMHEGYPYRWGFSIKVNEGDIELSRSEYSSDHYRGDQILPTERSWKTVDGKLERLVCGPTDAVYIDGSGKRFNMVRSNGDWAYAMERRGWTIDD